MLRFIILLVLIFSATNFQTNSLLFRVLMPQTRQAAAAKKRLASSVTTYREAESASASKKTFRGKAAKGTDASLSARGGL